jgi:hypothetical protein
MKHDEQALQRLLEAARRSQPEPPDALPFGLEARILAGWRAAGPEDESLLLAMLFRRAVIFAALIMVAAIGWSRLEEATRVPGATVIANLEKVLQIVP